MTPDNNFLYHKPQNVMLKDKSSLPESFQTKRITYDYVFYYLPRQILNMNDLQNTCNRKYLIWGFTLIPKSIFDYIWVVSPTNQVFWITCQ